MTEVFIPVCLLDAIFDEHGPRACDYPGLARQIVTACVLGGGGRDDRDWRSPATLKAAHEHWAGQGEAKPRTLTVGSVLVELLERGLVTDIRLDGDGYQVEVSRG